MTDQEKVLKMFEIRKEELKDDPDIDEKSFERIKKKLTNPSESIYFNLLMMYNERYGEESQNNG